jgi:hypothetical protein
LRGLGDATGQVGSKGGRKGVAGGMCVCVWGGWRRLQQRMLAQQAGTLEGLGDATGQEGRLGGGGCRWGLRPSETATKASDFL